MEKNMDNNKIKKTFRLSPLAVEILDKQKNATKYIEDLIINRTPTEQSISKVTKADIKKFGFTTVDDVFSMLDEMLGAMPPIQQKSEKERYLEIENKNYGVSSNGRKAGFEPVNIGSTPVVPAKFIPKAPDPELGYSCCQKSTPCKHWVWDIASGEGYINTLTGKVREV